MREIDLAVMNGAEEVDFVLNYESLGHKDGDKEFGGEELLIEQELGTIRSFIDKNYRGLVTKLILETSELTNDQISRACKIADRCRIDFVKTSTGFSAAGATAEHLRIMRTNFSRGVKMSGGVSIGNVKDLLYAASGRTDGYIDLDPMKIRIGESSLLKDLSGQEKTAKSSY